MVQGYLNIGHRYNKKPKTSDPYYSYNMFDKLIHSAFIVVKKNEQIHSHFLSFMHTHTPTQDAHRKHVHTTIDDGRKTYEKESCCQDRHTAIICSVNKRP